MTPSCSSTARAAKRSLEFLGWKQREIAVSEFRFRPMEWAVMTPPESG